ncbi:MAG: rhomboid family intramembrane serine protease [Candidatus Marinimicrobia bacterium]|nr:rhomboid family intramembrane serine protease [Candidatus Neomarinimicrobiota bacterium]MCH7762802.1 rhomboid family intramembrane serine protease [Candidatus Neomarinimicrobiota bacterium]
MRYQFQSEHGNVSFKPKFFTEAIKVLIWINIGLFILKELSASQVDLARLFGLSPNMVWPMIWQPVTYMFIHGDIFHVLINMFVLWMFGSEMESIWGRTEFLRYYFLTGVGSGLIWLLFNIAQPYSVLIGASGAIYGILLAYGMMFPNRTVYLYFLIPIKVKWFVIFLGVIAFVSSLNNYSNISHITHLSGMVIGFIYLRYYRRWKDMKFSIHKQLEEFRISRTTRKKQQRMKMQRKVDQLLDKINKVGYEKLTEEEKDLLYKASQDFSRGREKD